MDEFNLNNQNGFTDNTTDTTGNVSGFDSVNGKPTDPSSPAGYTVTPDGGYYTKPHSEIIQDEAIVRHSTENEQFSSAQSSNNTHEQYYTNPNTYNTQNQYTANQEYRNPYSPPAPQQHKPVQQKRGVALWVVILSAVLAAVIGACGGAAIVFTTKDGSSHIYESSNKENTNVNITVDETVGSAAQAVAKKASSSVVGIRTITSVMSFFGGSSEATGEGSGVIYTENGYIITNYHVISSAIESNTSSKIEVFLENNQSEPYQATVVGYNISSDLAVIKINATNLPAVELGDSDKLEVGQYVITIGNPGGLEFMGSVTYGIISGLNRTVSTSTKVELIQTDAAINPGNSGGALLDTEGKLIGINSSKIVAEEYEGMGFAIPVNTVKDRCDKIIARENDPEPYIGITISEKYTPAVLEYYGYPVGAVVLSVDPDSPAYTAGIRRGDIITEFNGTAIDDYTIFGDLLLDCKPEQTVSLTIYRSGRNYSLNLTIGSNN